MSNKNNWLDPNTPLLASLSDGVISLDHEFAIQWWNSAARKLLRLKKQHKDQTITNIIKCSEFNDYLQSAKDNTIHCTIRNNKAISAKLLRSSEHPPLLIVKDISQGYFLDKMRQDFIANVSHELRTPLTVIHGYLETLIDHAEQQPSKSPYHDIYQQMQQQTKRMEALVTDLLLLSRLEAKAPDQAEYEVVDIDQMLRGIYQDTCGLSQNRHQIALKTDSSIGLKGNFAELRSAFTNLTYNAVRYTPEGGQIDINWYQDDKGAHLSVSDTGIGIPKKHIQRLTERFYRVDKGRSRDEGGTGLGLAIVKHVLLRHDATLTIKSEEGQGSTFICSFPDPQPLK